MKKTFFILLLSVFVFLIAEGLDTNASYIKTNYSNEYEETIKKHALEKWNDDYKMVVYEIDNQADTLIELINLFNSENTNIVFNAIQKWSIDGYEESNITLFKEFKTFSLKELLKLHCDWKMVKYEYDNQVKAKNSF
ncbi:MAG: hypothetical protein HQ554_06465 [FCB group bacterium]|nr:hypothetical protein [FCB group bacterium]